MRALITTVLFAISGAPWLSLTAHAAATDPTNTQSPPAVSPAATSTDPATAAPPGPATSAVASQSANASAPTATPAAQAKAVAVTGGDTDAQMQLKTLKAAGYKPEVHGSEIWFCRQETVIGSRFEKKVCNTADQLQHIAADARQQTDNITRHIAGTPKTKLP